MPRLLSRKNTEPTEIASGPNGPGALVAAQGLESRQTKAMEAIMLGRSVQEAADAADVDRATLYRWRMSDPPFMRALAKWREDVTAAAYERLAGLSAAATTAVQTAIEAGDGRLGFRLLHSMRATQPPAAPPEASDERAVAFMRWLLHVPNPGARPEGVEAFVMERFKLSPRDAGNVTYRSYEINLPLKRPAADALMKELNELGAYVAMRRVEVVRMEDDMPNGYTPGPSASFPPDAGPPAFFNVPPHHPGLDAHHAKLKKRTDELEAMDEADEEARCKAAGIERRIDPWKYSPPKSP